MFWPFNALSWAFLPSCAQGYSSLSNQHHMAGRGWNLHHVFNGGHSLTIFPTIFTKYDTLNPCIECAAKVTLRFGSSVSGKGRAAAAQTVYQAHLRFPFPLRPSPLPVHMQRGLLTQIKQKRKAKFMHTGHPASCTCCILVFSFMFYASSPSPCVYSKS